MNNTFSLQQLSRTNTFSANLISRQYILNLMADFMRMKYENPKLKQSEIAKLLGYFYFIKILKWYKYAFALKNTIK